MNCIIVDDEAIARTGIRRLVDMHPELELSAELGGAGSAAEFLDNHKVDLIFLDIQMPGINGIEFARKIPYETMVIFTTAYSEYAVESYEVEAIDYLVKPINRERFGKAVARAMSYHKLLASASRNIDGVASQQDCVIVKADRRFMRIKLSDIMYIEGLKDYIIIHLQSGRIISRMLVKDIWGMLPTSKFLRVNKSYIVNIGKVDSFDNNYIFIGDSEIVIGISYRESVLERLSNP